MSVIGLVFVLVVRVLSRAAFSALRAARPPHDAPASAQRHASASAAWSRSTTFRSTIEPGELRAIIGPNGAGKTTFFNLISGFFPPTSGAILFDGEDITGAVARTAGQSRHGAHVPDHRDLSRTHVADNLRIAVEVAAGLRMTAWLGRARRREVDARVDELARDGRPRRQAGQARRRAVARRPARHRNHDGAGAAPAPADARRADGGHGRSGNLRYRPPDPPPAPAGTAHHHADRARHARRVQSRRPHHGAGGGQVLAEGTPDEIAGSEAVQAAYLGKAAA